MSERDSFEVTPTGSPANPVSRPPEYQSQQGYPGPPPYDEEEGGGFELRKVPGILFRYKWLILASLVLGFLAANVAAMMTAPRFTVGALVQTSDAQARETGVTAIQAGPTRSPADWQNLLRSFSVMEPVAIDQKMFVSSAHPEYPDLFDSADLVGEIRPGRYTLEVEDDGRTITIRDRDGAVVQRSEDRSEAGVPLGVRLNPDGDRLRSGLEVPFSLIRARDAAREINGNLQIQGGPTAYMAVQYTANSANRAADELNAVLESFIREATELTRARSDELSRTLADQLASARESLADAEAALEAHQAANVLRPSESGGSAADDDGAMGRFMARQLDLQDLERDRAAIERAMGPRETGQGIRIQALEAIPAVQGSSELRRILEDLADLRAERRSLLTRYTPDYPPVLELERQIELLEQEVIPGSVSELEEELDARISRLRSEVGAQAAELGSVPARAMTESGLRREVERAEALYQDVSARYENARLASLSETPDVRVVDWADPPTRPDADRRALLAGLAFFAFLGAGLLGAILLDRLDRRVRSPGDVEYQLGVPVLGVLPHLRLKRRSIQAEHHEQAVEAFRSVRTGLLYAHGTAGPFVMTISSPGEGDGKSFTASNLALSFAELGRRTVLIDGDVRRGVQHELLDVERKPGLSDFLADGLPPDAVIRQCRHPNLSVIPLGSRMSNAPELLSTGRMQELLADLREEYDVIIIDSCPLGAAADPVILGVLTGSLALVVRSGTTNVEHAEAMLQNLRRYPVRILGAIVNDVSARDDYSYYGYISGYSVDPSQDERGSRRELQLTGPE